MVHPSYRMFTVYDPTCDEPEDTEPAVRGAIGDLVGWSTGVVAVSTVLNVARVSLEVEVWDGPPGGFAVGSAPAGVTFVATQRQGSPRASRARVSCSAKPASPASLQPTATRRLLPAATATIASAMVVTSVRWRAIVARLSILNALLR